MEPTEATKEWRQIARGSDPLYDIASVPGKRGKWTEEDFYAHGRADWAYFKRHWDHYTDDRGGTVVEIGCGGGRLTCALAGSFERVIAVDVSEDMLTRTRSVAPQNVELRQTDGRTLPVEDASVDAVFTAHVLQHLETRDDVVNYIREARRVLRPGGTAMIHIMLKSAHVGLRDTVRNELRLRRSRLALRLGREHTTMRVRTYWITDVWHMFVDAGFEDIEQRMIPTDDYGHQFWLVTAPGGRVSE